MIYLMIFATLYNALVFLFSWREGFTNWWAIFGSLCGVLWFVLQALQ